MSQTGTTAGCHGQQEGAGAPHQAGFGSKGHGSRMGLAMRGWSTSSFPQKSCLQLIEANVRRDIHQSRLGQPPGQGLREICPGSPASGTYLGQEVGLRVVLVSAQGIPKGRAYLAVVEEEGRSCVGNAQQSSIGRVSRARARKFCPDPRGEWQAPPHGLECRRRAKRKLSSMACGEYSKTSPGDGVSLGSMPVLMAWLTAGVAPSESTTLQQRENPTRRVRIGLGMLKAKIAWVSKIV